MRDLSKTYVQLIADVQPPEGWELTVDIDKSAPGLQLLEGLEEKVRPHLPAITKRLEAFMRMAYRSHHIFIPESLIYIDAASAFSVVFMVNKEDFHSPDMTGLKIDAANYLQSADDIDLRVRFAIAEEYNRFNLTQRAFKLRYSHKSPSAFRKAS